MIMIVGGFAIVFFYSGTFFNWSGVKGLYLAFKAWTETGAAGHGHEKAWDYFSNRGEQLREIPERRLLPAPAQDALHKMEEHEEHMTLVGHIVALLRSLDTQG